MAPKRGLSIERDSEYEEFLNKLTEYHKRRGTHLDSEPKVGVRHIDLSKLYMRVVEEGGYDLVSDTKAKPLMWRRLAEEFVGRNPYTAAQAFQIKNVYYKNLCAYEISTHWGKEPPPKEILELVTAKGGNVMGRTIDNFEFRTRREERNLDGDASDSSPPGQKTPSEDKMDEEPGSTAGSRTRGLRQQPPQRVLFQPDLTSARQTRGAVQTTHGSPAPSANTNGATNTSHLFSGASSTLASYEPSQSYPLSLKPVITPANNPEFYRIERKRKLEANAGPLAKKYRNIMLPGTGFVGPNIYVRAQLALQSQLPEEEQYALHHLVKISHERGDKYKFEQFPGLAEALVKKALQVSGLFYDVDWEISYDEDFTRLEEETLNGLHGTSDVIRKLRSRTPHVTNDTMQDAAFLSQLNRITEAGLVIRNMCLQDDNAQYLSRLPLVRDYLAIVLDLPQHSCIVELQHYALDTAEQVMKYCDIGTQDALFTSLLLQLERKDRGAICVALRTISRIAMHLQPPKRLDDIPEHLLQRVQDWLLVDDEELRSACLDILMQYTSFADNVDRLIQILDAASLARQLSRLLLFAAKEHREQRPPPRQAIDNAPAPVPRLSRNIVENLLNIEEPERSSEWLRMCFLPDPSSEMTQISLWQAYQATFNPFHATHPHLIAGDFIKNVSNTFTGATAQVAGNSKYVIKGIRARKLPVETGMLAGSKGAADKGKELQKCCWKISAPVDGHRDPVTGIAGTLPGIKDVECGEWFRNEEDMLHHILSAHLHLPTKPPSSPASGDRMDIDSESVPARPASATGLTNGSTVATGAKSQCETFDFRTADATSHKCRWALCQRGSEDFADSKAPRTVLFVRHIRTHLPETDATKSKHNLKPDSNRAPLASERTFLTTLQDEKGDAAGIALGAALVLRNIAKFMPGPGPSTSSASVINEVLGGEKPDDKKEECPLMELVFDEEVRERLFYALAHNTTIKTYVGSVLGAINAR